MRALLLNGKGASPDALALATSHVRRKESLLGATHADLVPSLLNLGDALVIAGQDRQAIETARRAVTLRERNHATDLDIAEALDHLGSALTSAGRYEEALSVLDRSLRSKEAALPATDVRIARTLEEMAWALERKGDYGRSGPILRRAAAIQERADADHPEYAETLTLLGLQLWFEGDLLEARDVSARAVAAAERTCAPITRALRVR